MRSSLFGRVGLGWLKSLPAPALPTRATCRVGSDAFMAFRCLGSLPEPTECAGFARTVALFFLNRPHGAKRAPGPSAPPDVSVLLLEAGASENASSAADRGQWLHNLNSERDWDFCAEPKPISCRKASRAVHMLATAFAAFCERIQCPPAPMAPFSCQSPDRQRNGRNLHERPPASPQIARRAHD